MKLHEKIRRKREELGYSQEYVAQKVGMKQQSYDAVEAGRTIKSRFLPEILTTLGLPLTELSPSLAVSNDTKFTSGRGGLGSAVLSEDLLSLPVYASAEGGQGILIINQSPIDTVPRPEPLATVRGAYAVLITGDSMVPRYRPGDLALVNPHLPPRREDGVILYSEERDKAAIKEFVRQEGSLWRLKRYLPKQAEFTLSRKEWPVCHVVVGSYSRR